MKKRIISLSMVFALIIGLVNINVFSKTNDFNKQMSLLIKIGAISAEGDMSTGTKIKRERFTKEFTAFINKSDNIDMSQKPNKSYYYDVALDNEYISYINYLTEAGFVIGDDGENFRPDDYITNSEMLKCVVSALGYTAQASMAQYPDGYLSVASSLKLTNKISNLNEDATIASMVQLFYNALDANVMEVSLNESGTYEINKELTYLEKAFDIYKITGQIDGNYLTSLSGDKKQMKQNTVTINGEEFLLNEENLYLADMIGYNMLIYYHEDGTDNEIIAALNDKTEELVISESQIEGYKDGKIIYNVGNEKNEKAAIDKNAVIMYNGVVVTSYTDDIFTNISNGSIELLKSEDDSKYSVIKIYNYSSYIVKSAWAEENKIFFGTQRIPNPEYTGTGTDQSEYIYSNPTLELDDYENVFIRNAFGQTLKLSDIQIDNIVSVGESMDGTVCYINVETSLVSGKVDSVYKNSDGNECVKINGNEYILDVDFDKNIDFKLSVGLNIIAYMNYKGKIAAMVFGSNSGEWVYGYMMNMIYDDSNEEYLIKVFTSAGKAEKYKLKDKVRVDGVSKKKENVYDYFCVIPGASDDDPLTVEPQLIKYCVNNGVVSKIDTAVLNKSGSEVEETSLTKDKEYGSYKFFWNTKRFVQGGSYNYDKYDTSLRGGDNTLVFFVPDPTDSSIGYNSARTDETLYMVKIGTGYFVNHQNYSLEAYDVDYNNGALASVLVSKAGESDKYEGNIVIDYLEYAIDEDDRPCVKIVGYNLGAKSTTTYTLKNDVETFEDISNQSNPGSKPNWLTWETSIDDANYGLRTGDVIRVKTVSEKVTKMRRYFSPTYVGRQINNKDIISYHGVIQSDGTFMGESGSAVDTVMVGVLTGTKNGYLNFYNVDPAISRGEKAADSRGAVPKYGKIVCSFGSKAIYKCNTKTNKLEVIDSNALSGYLYKANMKAYAYMYTNQTELQTIVVYE